MIKAIIFDNFGVLQIGGWNAFIETYFYDDHEKMNRAHDSMNACQAGVINMLECINELAKLAKVSRGEAELFIDRKTKNVRLLEYIASSVKPRSKVAILSHSGGNYVANYLTLQEREMFDVIIQTGSLGETKPDIATYKTMVEQLNVEPSECLFVDSGKHFVGAAKAQGMLAHQFTDTRSCIAVIERALK